MLIRKSYRFRLNPTAKQAVAFNRSAGSCRLVWNKMLETQKKRLESKERILSYADSCRRLVELKNEFPFLKEVHSQALQQSLKDLDRALQDSFNSSKGFPKFKRRGKNDSFRYPQGTRLDGNQIYLPKIGMVRFIKSREVQGIIKNVTVSRENEHWYVSIQVEMEVAEPVHPSNSIVGIDLGVVRFATLSDGTFAAPINSFYWIRVFMNLEDRWSTSRSGEAET
jgi:putative transposase